MPPLNPKVDDYIARSPVFARPILEHVRALVHDACPAAVEEIKWSRPFFVYKSEILCNLAAFKEHCSFGFWGAEIGRELRKGGVLQDEGMGSLGRITSVSDLPTSVQMLGYIRRAAELIDCGKGENRISAARRVVKARKPELDPPEELSAALAGNTAAARVFASFNPSCRREYMEWIAEAKRAETRQRRASQAVEWIAEGKQRNWKYQVKESPQ